LLCCLEGVMAERARGLGGAQEGEDPQKVAADMLVKLGVDVRPPHPPPPRTAREKHAAMGFVRGSAPREAPVKPP